MPYKQVRTRCNKDLARLMLDYATECGPSFSKSFFEDFAIGRLQLSDTCEIMRIQKQIRGIYAALCRMNYIPSVSFRMMFPNTESFRDGLKEILSRYAWDYKNNQPSLDETEPEWMNLHFLDLDVRDEEEAKRFRYLTEVVLKR